MTARLRAAARPGGARAGGAARQRTRRRAPARHVAATTTPSCTRTFATCRSFSARGDLVVLNTTATLPAAVETTCHISTPLPGGLVVVEPRDPHGFEPSDLPGEVTVTLLAPYRDSQRLWIARFDGVERSARVPRRATGVRSPTRTSTARFRSTRTRPCSPTSRDRRRCRRPAARSRAEMLVCLRRRGVRLAKLVLHAGVASLEIARAPYEEQYEVPLRTAEEVRRAKERGGRVVAVGTTVVRALESSVDRARQRRSRRAAGPTS